MPNLSEQSRRDFMMLAAAGATTLAIGSIRADAPETENSGWINGQRINPAIPNTLVVYCTDLFMVRSTPVNWSFANQNAVIDTARVEANLDKIAIRLTGAASAMEAWKTIFMKPASKPDFSSVRVAIKVNCINTSNMPRIAIVGKVCKELIRLGAAAGNITIYDSCSGASGSGKYTPFVNKGLPQGVTILATTKDGPNVPVGSGILRCSPAIAKSGLNGIEYVADILINCAVNKGHGSGYGGFTMTMKNHTGTLKYSCPSSAEIIDENKSEAVIGTMGNPALPPRQQLCIVDSLWAATGGPGGPPDHQNATIAMGTVAPVIDYTVAEHIRKNPAIMNTKYNETVVNNWLTGFGIDKAQVQWIGVSADDVANDAPQIRDPRVLNVRVRGRGGSFVTFNLPENSGRLRIDILAIDGRIVSHIEPSGNDVVWDGLLSGGKAAPPGYYIIQLHYASGTISREMRLL